MFDETIETETNISTTETPKDTRTLDELMVVQTEMAEPVWGFGFSFGDKSIFYTGKAGKGFLNADPNEAWCKYSKEGAMRKALNMAEKYADTLLAPMTNVVLLRA
jgi:hypothetical protein